MRFRSDPRFSNSVNGDKCGLYEEYLHQLVRNRFESPSLLDSEKLDYTRHTVVMLLWKSVMVMMMKGKYVMVTIDCVILYK
jgi:hypothetical protein